MAKRINLNELAMETFEYEIGEEIIIVPADPLLPVQTRLQELLVNTGLLIEKLKKENKAELNEEDVKHISEINKQLYEYNIEAAILILGQNKSVKIDRDFIENNLSSKQLNLIVESYVMNIAEVEQSKNSKSPRSQQQKKKNS